jgi:hypothetical protein
MPYGISPEFEIPTEEVRLHKGAEIPDVTKVVDGRSAAEERHLGMTSLIDTGFRLEVLQTS